MLKEYFEIDIDDQQRLIGLPMIVKGYNPNRRKLAMFLKQLGLTVDWTKEMECFTDVSKVISKFYSLLPNSKSPIEKVKDMEIKRYRWVVEHCVFPAFKSMFFPEKKENADKYYHEVTSLQALYRVFERC
jgi:DNA mismatch repair protein MLH1